MIRCRQCAALYPSTRANCSRCSWAPSEVDGFTAWAPELTSGGTALRDASFGLLAEHEPRHFWFQARNELIVWALRRYFPDFRTFLEIGCGSGVVLSAVAIAFPAAALTGTELSTAGLKVAAARVYGTALVQMDGLRIPYEEEFDVIGAFDVLEHIEDDEAVLAQMRGALAPGGGIVVSVPQHRWLWSGIDEYSRHFRRYTRQELSAKLQRAGFRVERMTSFMTLVLPAIWLSRLTMRDEAAVDPSAELKIGDTANRVLGWLCACDRRAIASGWPLPIGGSLLAVARRGA